MAKPLAIAIVLLSFLALLMVPINSCAASEDSWATKAPMNQARSGLGVAVVNGKIYAIGGYNRLNSGIVGTNEEYDPATDKWTYKAAMPNPRTSFGIAVYQNKIYCIGGETNGSLAASTNEVYNPASDTWETKTPMPTARYGITANLAGGKIYLISGLVSPYLHSPIPLSNVNEVYDPNTDSWATKTSIPAEFYGYSSAVVNGKIYVLGGQGTKESNLNQIYDTQTDKWSIAAPLPGQSYYAAAAAITGVLGLEKIYVLGGTGANPRYSNQVYDPKNDSWTIGAQIPTDRIYLSVAAVDGRLYAVGGMQNSGVLYYVNPSKANEQYTPAELEVAITSSPLPSPTFSVTSSENSTPTLAPSPSVPEFPAWITLPIALAATLAATLSFKRKKQLQNGQAEREWG